MSHQLISHSQTRKLAQKAIQAFASKMRFAKDLPLEYVNEELIPSLEELITKSQSRSRNAVREHYDRQVSVAYLGVATFSAYAAIFSTDESVAKYLFSRREDWLAFGLFSRITNHSLGVIRLVEDGLDTAARPLLRTVQEMTWLTLAIFDDENLLKLYLDTPTESELKIWRKHFTAEALNKTLAALEKKLADGLETDLIAEMSRIRGDSYSHHSKHTHTAPLAGLMGAYSSEIGGDKRVVVNILGTPSRAMDNILYTLIWTLHYFNMMFHRIIQRRRKELPRTAEFFTAMALSETFFNVWAELRAEDIERGID